MAHWEYILWGVGGPAGFAAAWRYAPGAFLMLVGGLTKDLQRSKQCAEMLRLQRKDAKDLPSYLVDSHRGTDLPPCMAVPPDRGSNSTPETFEAVPDHHARAS